jgi:hypothetical protein
VPSSELLSDVPDLSELDDRVPSTEILSDVPDLSKPEPRISDDNASQDVLSSDGTTTDVDMNVVVTAASCVSPIEHVSTEASVEATREAKLKWIFRRAHRKYPKTVAKCTQPSPDILTPHPLGPTTTDDCAHEQRICVGHVSLVVLERRTKTH